MNDDKIIRVDGLPGITVQGKRGDKGNRGCHTWCFPESHVLHPYIDDASTAIGSVTDLSDTSISAICENNDYILHQKEEKTYLYRTLSTTSGEEPDAVECIDSWICDEAFDITVIANPSYVTYDRAVLSDSSVSAEATNLKFISFDIVSNDVTKLLGNIKVEVEFISKSISAGTPSAFPSKWNWDSIDSSHIASSSPFGYIENYKSIVNFDDEGFGDFKITIKDFNEAYNYTSYSSPIKVRCSEEGKYTIKVYVYNKKNGHVLRKEFLGEIDIDEI